LGNVKIRDVVWKIASLNRRMEPNRILGGGGQM